MMVFLANLLPGACNFHSHLLFLCWNLAFESLFPLNSCSCYAFCKQGTPGTAPFRGRHVLPCGPLTCPSQAGSPAPSLSLLIPLASPRASLPRPLFPDSCLWLVLGSWAAQSSAVLTPAAPETNQVRVLVVSPSACLSKSLQLFPAYCSG